MAGKTPDTVVPDLTVQIVVPEGYFTNLRAMWEEAQTKADSYKKQHDQTLDVMLRVGAPVPEGTERLEKRGRPAKDSAESPADTAEVNPAESPTE